MKSVTSTTGASPSSTTLVNFTFVAVSVSAQRLEPFRSTFSPGTRIPRSASSSSDIRKSMNGMSAAPLYCRSNMSSESLKPSPLTRLTTISFLSGLSVPLPSEVPFR